MFDFVSVTLVVLAITLFLYASTFIGTEVAYQALTAVVLLTSGLTMAFLLGRIKPDFRLSSKEWTSIATWTGVSMGAIFVVNLVRQLKFEVAPMDPRLFTILIGVSEEVFFRVFLCAWLVLLLGEMLGILASSGIWTVYHFAVYSTTPSALMVIFGSGIVIGYAFVKSHRASVPMLSHCLVNLVAAV